MTTQNNMATLVQIGYDAYNDHSFDTHWLQRAAAPIAEECEVVDVPSGAVLHGPEGLKHFLLGFSTCVGYLGHPFLNKGYRTRKEPLYWLLGISVPKNRIKDDSTGSFSSPSV